MKALTLANQNIWPLFVFTDKKTDGPKTTSVCHASDLSMKGHKKEKILVASIFSYSHVSKICLEQGQFDLEQFVKG